MVRWFPSCLLTLLLLSWGFSFAQSDAKRSRVQRFLKRLDELEGQLKAQNEREKIRKAVLKKYLAQGREQYQNSDFSGAAQTFNRAMMVDPLSPASFVWLGRIENYKKNYKLAIQFLEEALFRKDSLKIRKELALIYYSRALTLLTANETEKAILDLDRAIEESSSFAEAYFQKGNALSKLNRLKEAEDLYKRALAISQESSQELAGAKEELEKITQQRREKANTLLQKGMELQNQGNFVEAQDYFSQAVAMHPENPDIWRALGKTLLQNGLAEDGIQAFFKVIQLDATDLTTLDILIQALKKSYTRTLFSAPEENRKCKILLKKALKIALENENLTTEKIEVYQQINEVIEK